MTSPLDSGAQTALLTLFQTSLLARLDLTKLIDVALQGLEVLVIKIRYIRAVLKNLCHYLLGTETNLAVFLVARRFGVAKVSGCSFPISFLRELLLKRYIVEIDWFVTYILNDDVVLLRCRLARAWALVVFATT